MPSLPTEVSVLRLLSPSLFFILLVTGLHLDLDQLRPRAPHAAGGRGQPGLHHQANATPPGQTGARAARRGGGVPVSPGGGDRVAAAIVLVATVVGAVLAAGEAAQDHGLGVKVAQDDLGGGVALERKGIWAIDNRQKSAGQQHSSILLADLSPALSLDSLAVVPPSSGSRWPEGRPR